MKSTPENTNWIKQGLFWSVWMYVWVTLLSPLMFKEEISLKKMLIAIPFWLVAGLGYGYMMKYFNRKKEEKV